MPSKELIVLPIDDIIPYERNPRINDIAVEDVKQSIIQCGYVAPIIVDENNEILAGHTRWKAFKELGTKDVQVIRVKGMTEAQKKKYRLLDNKVAEKAAWDYELLSWELEDIDFEGFNFGFENISDMDVDGMFEDAPPKEKKAKTITCPHCGEVFSLDDI